MCGEKLSAVFTSCINLGSPPRVRGKGVPCSARRLGRGITPARAGKSVCGEKFIFVTTQISALRITPACAGKSLSISFSVAFFRDHPRVCGEKAVAAAATVSEPGITPACAGKRLGCHHWWMHKQDHPRVCGEKAIVENVPAVKTGSPPRVRGKVHNLARFWAGHRITPACAGKRMGPTVENGPLWDHPRVCGEKQCPAPLCFALTGSPPRVRGKARKQSKQ